MDKQLTVNVPSKDDRGFMRFQRLLVKAAKAERDGDALGALMVMDEILERYTVLEEGQSFDDVIGDMTADEYTQLFTALTSVSEEEKKD